MVEDNDTYNHGKYERIWLHIMSNVKDSALQDGPTDE